MVFAECEILALVGSEGYWTGTAGAVNGAAAAGRQPGSAGTRVLLERLQAAGFASLDQPAQHYGLGLTLGNGEVTLLELAQVDGDYESYEQLRFGLRLVYRLRRFE